LQKQSTYLLFPLYQVLQQVMINFANLAPANIIKELKKVQPHVAAALELT